MPRARTPMSHTIGFLMSSIVRISIGVVPSLARSSRMASVARLPSSKPSWPHFNQRTVTPSLVVQVGGSPRNSGTASSRSSAASLKMEKSSPAMKSLMTPSFPPFVTRPLRSNTYKGGPYSTELPALASWYDLILFPVREREWRLHGLLWGPVAVFPGRSLRWLRSLDFQGLGDAVLSEGGITGSASVSTMLAGTAEHVCSMHGPDRIPTLLKRVDSLSRRAG